MNADRLVWWVRDWLDPGVGHRHICVHRRSSAAQIPFFWIAQPKPNAARQGSGPVRPHAAAKPGPTVPIKPSRTDPLNREPTAKPATAPFKPSRIDPLNREPTAKLGSTVPFKPIRIDPLNREPTAKPRSTAPFKPSRIDPLNRELTPKTGAIAPMTQHRVCMAQGLP